MHDSRGDYRDWLLRCLDLPCSYVLVPELYKAPLMEFVSPFESFDERAD